MAELNDSVGASDDKRCSFPLACMRFFGKKSGETTIQFSEELKALTPQDKADLKVMFESIGYQIT